jgi:actin-related protein
MFPMFILLKIQFYHVSLQVNWIFYILGRSTALVCDSGDSYTKIVAVHDGYCLYKSAKTIPYAGNTLTQNIRKLV